MAGESWVVGVWYDMQMCIPTACGEMVMGKDVEAEAAMGDNPSWVAVPDLRKLVSLVEELKAAAQGAWDESTESAGKANNRTASMGANTGAETAGNAPDPERNDMPPDEEGERR